jgi:hypothetical protein
VKLGKVLRQLSKGSRVAILRKTVTEETITGLTAPWYRVSIIVGEDVWGQTLSQEGWVFGAYVEAR